MRRLASVVAVAALCVSSTTGAVNAQEPAAAAQENQSQSLVEKVTAAESARESATPQLVQERSGQPADGGFVEEVRAEDRGLVAETPAGEVTVSGESTTPFTPAEQGHRVSENRVTREHDDNSVSGYAVLAPSDSAATWKATTPRNTELRTNETGGLSLLIKEGAGQLEVRDFISAPWAVDTAGNPVPTHYTVEGDKITQVIDRGQNDLEVVADPRLTFGFGVYLNMFGHEADVFGRALGATGLAAGWTACNVIDKVGGWGRIVERICQAAPGVSLVTLWNLVQLPPQFDPNTCYQVKLAPGNGLVPVDPTNCTG